MAAVLDEGTGVYLKNSKVRAFSLLDSVTHTLPPSSVKGSCGLDFHPQQGDCCWSGKVGYKVVHALQLLSC